MFNFSLTLDLAINIVAIAFYAMWLAHTSFYSVALHSSNFPLFPCNLLPTLIRFQLNYRKS